MVKIISKLFRIKTVDSIVNDAEKQGEHLKKTLGWLDLIFLGIGAIIGAGIFATIGTAAAGDIHRPGAGPALMVSFLLTALACGFSALCYAEFAAMVPIAGSAYTYSYTTLGEIIAWIIGWDLIIEYAIGNVAVAISWSGYFSEFLAGFGLHLPKWLCIDYRTAIHSGVIDTAPHIFGIPVVINLPAVAIIAILTTLIVIGIKESVRFNEIMVGTKLLILAFFCIIGFFYIKPENFTPFAPNGFHGILTGASIVFFAYIGFDAVSTLAEETKDPGRNLPIGIIGSLIICTVVYVLVTAVFTGIVPFKALTNMLSSEKAEPLTMALKYIANEGAAASWGKKFLDISAGIVAFGAVVASTAVLLVFQIGQPRILFSMSRDGLLPKKFMSIHKKFKTPYFATILTGIFVAGFAAFMSIDEMVDLCNIGTLFAFILVCAGIIILRIRDPHRKRPFKVFGGYAVPVLGIISCLTLICGLPITTFFRFVIWLLLGLVFYGCYGYWHSRLSPANADRGNDVPKEVLEDMDKF